MRGGADASARAHVAGCETCRVRVERLRTSAAMKPVPLSARRTLPPGPNPFAEDEHTQQAHDRFAPEPGNEGPTSVGYPPGFAGAPAPPAPARVSRAPMPPSADLAFPETQDIRSTAISKPRPMEPHEPGDTIGRFVVLQRVGEGGMGVVYAAYDPELDRKVAIKLMRSDVAASRAGDLENRLLREAQAMARLSHPNVIPVYDVGTVDGQVFVAMEFVEGKTLSQYLRAQEGWRPAIDAHLQAGAGLAAAHAAGLIHRDFKPQNVLVSNDGQVRVLDFGLARPSGQSEPPQAPVPGAVEVPASSRSPSGRPLLETPLTQSDLVLGTPAYMSPEQFSAGVIDARTDQFAFCVSLYEALYGTRPFAGETVQELVDAIAAGQVQPPPRGSKVPSRFFRILKRGLAAKPDDRFPTMTVLLAELRRDPGAKVRRAAAGVAVLSVIGAAVAFSVWSGRQQRTLCTGAESRLAGAWDSERKGALMKAFIETGIPYAPSVFSTATSLLDGYTAAWVKMRTDACEATRVRGEQSERLLDLRIQCLDRKLGEVSALLDLFARPDVKIVDRAVPAVQGLGSLAECSDARALGAEPPKLDAQAKADLDAAYAKLAAAKAAGAALEPTAALALAQEALQLAQKSGQDAAVAEARLVVAELKAKAGDDAAAEAEQLSAVLAADAAKRDDLRAKALTELSLSVFKEGRATESLAWGQVANAALARAGGDDAVQARLHHVLALVFHSLGRPEDATAHFGRCLDLRKKAFGADSYVAAASMQAFGRTLHEQGKLDEAVQHLENAVALQQKALGAEHPDVASARQALASALFARGDLPRAETEQRAALGGLKDGVLSGGAHAELARILSAAGKSAQAVAEAGAALTSYLAALPATHPSVAVAYVQLAALQLESGDKAAALVTVRKAAVDVEASPPGLVAQAALVEAKAGVRAKALPKAKAVLAKVEKRAPKDAAVQALKDWVLLRSP